jgi:heat shock protein HslJ
MTTTMIKLRSAVAGLAAVALTASLGVVAMGAAETAPAESPEVIGVFSIEGLPWLLTSQVVDGVMTPLPEGVDVSLDMQDGSAGGTGGCNNYFAAYEIDGFDVSFSEIGSTLMACPSPAGDVENAYFTNLGMVASYQSGGIQMALKDADDEFLLEFDLAPPPSIVGSWQAQGINNGAEAVVNSATTSTVTAEYSADGQLTGNDGCNDYFTSYETDGDSITISPEIGSTRMACADEALADQSQQYYAALAAATTWSVDPQGSVELRDDGGSLQVRYMPAEG